MRHLGLALLIGLLLWLTVHSARQQRRVPGILRGVVVGEVVE